MRVSQAMVTEVATCHPGDSLTTAAGLMWDRDVGCLPVLDYEGRPLAMITDRDIAMSCYLTGRPLHEASVVEVMSKTLAIVKADQRIELAEELMRGARVRRLPVVDPEGRLVGIVSVGDLVRAVPPENKEAMAKTLVAVHEPRVEPEATNGVAQVIRL